VRQRQGLENAVNNTPLHPPVLVVDDNLALRTILSAILTQEGYRVQTAAHGGQALNVMRASPEPMVVTLDMKMPEVGGLVVLETVAADPMLLRRHAIILMTANVALATSHQVVTLRHQLRIPLLAKPYTSHQAVKAIAEAEQRLMA
jgi:CheY-like chemotaxis protein